MRGALETQLAELLDQSTERITDSFSPYSRSIAECQMLGSLRRVQKCCGECSAPV